MKICIDAGHGGSDPGAVGHYPSILNEKDVTLSISKLLKSELQDKGYSVYMTRDIDKTLSLFSRTNHANRNNADLFISIHCNSAANAQAEGIETWIYPSSSNGRRYADLVQNSLVSNFPEHKNRGIKEANFHVLRETNMPAILVECEFISNPNQLEFLKTSVNQKKLAKAIANAL